MRIEALVRKVYEVTTPYVGVASIEDVLLESSFLVVMEQARFVGILTPADVVRYSHRLVIDCLCDKPRVDYEYGIEFVLELMKESQNSVLPVFKGDEFIGVITQDDLTEYLFEYRKDLEQKVAERTAELATTNEQLQREIAERKRAGEALRKARDELEIRVQERTAELAKANEALRAEITERKRAEECRLRTERLAAMGRLAAALAHEINNPLQAISSSLELVLDFPLEEEERLEYLQAARREIERLMALTGRVLNFARPPRVEQQPTSAADVVHDALALVSKRLDYSDIRVSLDLPDVLPPVLASSSQLAQVFLNLIINAIEAMPDGGELSISARLAGEQVEVTFTDSGPGISPDAIARLFEPFYTTKENGTGLGLATSHSIIQQHGGTLTAGNAPGGGAVFTVALPIAPLDKPHLAERRL